MKKIFKQENKWLIYTFLFVAALISLTLLLQQGAWGIYTSVLLLSTLYVGSFLKLYFKDSQKTANEHNENLKTWRHIISVKNEIKLLSEKDLINSQRLLRYATAVLAFLSLTTTAQGMKTFVFDSAWMAYLGSFSVQSILVVFSLLLCRFYVQIHMLNWPAYVKKISTDLLIVFFCTALLVSSTFSFCYIANNAYKFSWASDRETVLQSSLLTYVYDLSKENERRGKIVLEDLNKKANEEMGSAITAINNKRKTALQDELKQYVRSYEFKKQKSGQVDIINKDKWMQNHRESAEDYELLFQEYEANYIPEFENSVDVYNEIASQLNDWKNEIPEKSEQNNMLQKINNEMQTLQNLSEYIDGWITSQVVRDNMMIKTTYKRKCKALRDQFSEMKTYIREIKRILKEQEEMEDEKDISGVLNQLLSQVYLLGVDPNINIIDLAAAFNNIAIEASESGLYKSTDIQSIVSIKNSLLQYNDYIKLQNKLKDYIEKRIKRTYRVLALAGTEEKNTEENENAKETQTQTENGTDIRTVYENQWIEIRNEDISSLFTYLKSLPDISNLEESSVYDENDVLHEVSILQRDLLGQLTAFEKAFNYFKYPFPVMAYFSLFIAVFFDIGAFFTGCFLYATDYFDIKK